MREADKKAFGEVLGDVLSLYGRQASVGVLRIWWAALERFDFEAVRHALALHVADADAGRFAPVPATIQGLIEGAPEECAAQAWTLVLRAVRELGPYRDVDLRDPTAAQVVREMGGFGPLCWSDSGDMPFREREFVRRYVSYARRRMVPAGETVFRGITGERRRAVAIVDFSGQGRLGVPAALRRQVDGRDGGAA